MGAVYCHRELAVIFAHCDEEQYLYVIAHFAFRKKKICFKLC
jgi:hypothetical protein